MKPTTPIVICGVEQVLAEGPPKVGTGYWSPTIAFKNPDGTSLYEWKSPHSYSDVHMAYDNLLSDAAADPFFDNPELLAAHRAQIRTTIAGRMRFRGTQKPPKKGK